MEESNQVQEDIPNSSLHHVTGRQISSSLLITLNIPQINEVPQMSLFFWLTSNRVDFAGRE